MVSRRAAAAVLLCAVAAAYATAFRGSWQFDDFRVIVDDARVHSLGAWWASMPGIRPLLKLSFAVNHQSGLGLAGFHAVNVALHAANVLLAFALLSRLGRRLQPSPPAGAALLGALLFAVHPVQTEAVTYLSGRSSALAAFFALASVLAFVVGRDDARPTLVHGVSPALLLCALGVKEGAVVVPVVLLLTEVLRPSFSWTAAAKVTAAHLGVVALAALLYLASPYRPMMEASLGLRGPLSNLLTHAAATLWLAGQLFRPWGLVADPGLPPVEAPTPTALGALGAIGLLAVTALLTLRRAPLFGFTVLWFLLWVAPQGWLLPRPEPANERQLYLAVLGPAWLAGAAWARVASGSIARRGLAAALVGGLAWVTSTRSAVYQDEVRFWSDVVAKAPWNARAHANLGHALALACRPPEAEAALLRALELDPGQFRAAMNLALLREGQLPPDATSRCGPGQRR